MGAGDVVGYLSPQADRLDAGGVTGHLERSLHPGGHVECGRCETERCKVGRGGGDRQSGGASVR